MPLLERIHVASMLRAHGLFFALVSLRQKSDTVIVGALQLRHRLRVHSLLLEQPIRGCLGHVPALVERRVHQFGDERRDRVLPLSTSQRLRTLTLSADDCVIRSLKRFELLLHASFISLLSALGDGRNRLHHRGDHAAYVGLTRRANRAGKNGFQPWISRHVFLLEAGQFRIAGRLVLQLMQFLERWQTVRARWRIQVHDLDINEVFSTSENLCNRFLRELVRPSSEKAVARHAHDLLGRDPCEGEVNLAASTLLFRGLESVRQGLAITEAQVDRGPVLWLRGVRFRGVPCLTYVRSHVREGRLVDCIEAEAVEQRHVDVRLSRRWVEHARSCHGPSSEGASECAGTVRGGDPVTRAHRRRRLRK